MVLIASGLVSFFRGRGLVEINRARSSGFVHNDRLKLAFLWVFEWDMRRCWVLTGRTSVVVLI